MSDPRTILERTARRIDPRSDAFERLERRRERKARNRRVTAGVVALLVAIGGSYAAFSAFRGGDDEQTIGGVEADKGFHALWPEATIAEAQAVQEAVEAGDPDLGFRLSADATAATFVRDVLLLEQFTIDGMTTINEPVDHRTGPVVVEIATPPPPCPTPTQLADICGPSTFAVTLDRLIGPEGVWSVTAVESSELSLADYLRAEVVPGQTSFELPTSLPDGTLVSAGFATTGSCQAAGETEVEVLDGRVRFQLQDGLTGCDGYLYLMHPPTGEGQVPVGQIMFIHGEPKPALGYHVQAMAAVPVRFVESGSGGTSGEVPDVALVECLGAEIYVATPVVRVQPDGFHITVVNVGDEEVSFSVMQDLGATSEGDGDVAVSSGQGGGTGAPPGETTSVWTFPPGTYSLSCSPPIEPGQAGVAGIGALEVVDPDRHYVPAELECATGEAYGSGGDYAEGTTGFAGDPVQVARDHVSGLEFDDIVERAGYRESELPVIRIVRDGAVVGKVTLRDDGSGGWLDDTIEGCGGTQFGWSEEPTGVSGPIGEDLGSVFLVMCGPARAAGGNNIHHGSDLHVDGQDLDFDTNCLIAPAGEPLTILFSNLDEGVMRNISIYTMTPCLAERLVSEQTDSCGAVDNDIPIYTAGGESITGVGEIVYELGPLQPGFYYFQDDFHPAANGVLIVE